MLFFCLWFCVCGFLSFQELPANSVLLIYLSATGVFPTGRADGEGTIKECSHREQGLNSLYFLQDNGQQPKDHFRLSREASKFKTSSASLVTVLKRMDSTLQIQLLVPEVQIS